MLRLPKELLLLWPTVRRNLSTQFEQPKKVSRFNPTKPENYMQHLIDRDSPLLKLSEVKVTRPPFIKTIYRKQFDERFLTYPDVLQNHQVDKVNEIYDKVKKYVDSLPADVMNDGAPADVLKQLESLDVFRLLLPYAEGGLELTITELARIMEAFGSQPSLGSIVATHSIAGIRTVLTYGSQAQRSKLLPGLRCGELLTAFAVEEEEEKEEEKEGEEKSSGRTNTVATTVDASSCVLSGRKIFVCNGNRADVFVVVTDFVDGDDRGKAVILLDRHLPGVTVESSPETAGLKGAGLTTVSFDHVKVPLVCVLGETGQRSSVAVSVTANVQMALAAAAVGTARSAFDQAFRHTFNTKRFDTVLCAFQLVQEKLALMATEIYVSESSLYMLTAIEDVVHDADLELESVATTLICTRTAKRVLETAIDIFGTKGYAFDSDNVRWLLDLVKSPYLGTGHREQRLLLAETGVRYAAEHVGEQRNDDHSLVDTRKALQTKLQRLFPILGNDGPDANGNLYQFLHPSLLTSANHLDFMQKRLSSNCELLLRKFGDDVIENRIVLNLLAEMTIDVFGLSNALARASRSYCIGLYNSYEEVKLCNAYAKVVLRRFDSKLKELQAILAEDALQQTVTTAPIFLEHKRYFALHPLSRK